MLLVSLFSEFIDWNFVLMAAMSVSSNDGDTTHESVSSHDDLGHSGGSEALAAAAAAKAAVQAHEPATAVTSGTSVPAGQKTDGLKSGPKTETKHAMSSVGPVAPGSKSGRPAQGEKASSNIPTVQSDAVKRKGLAATGPPTEPLPPIPKQVEATGAPLMAPLIPEVLPSQSAAGVSSSGTAAVPARERTATPPAAHQTAPQTAPAAPTTPPDAGNLSAAVSAKLADNAVPSATRPTLAQQMSQLRGDRSRHHSRQSTADGSQIRSRHHSRQSTAEGIHVSQLRAGPRTPGGSRNSGAAFYHSYDQHFSTTSLRDLASGSNDKSTFDPDHETADYVYVDRSDSSTRLEAGHLLYRTGSRLWEESREIKGQAWLGTRASSTALDEMGRQPQSTADDESDDDGALHMGRFPRSRVASFDSEDEETIGYFRRSRSDTADITAADIISRNRFFGFVDWILGLGDDVGGGSLSDFVNPSQRSRPIPREEKFASREEHNDSHPIDIAYVLGLAFSVVH